MEMKVKICDNCSEHIARSQCELCGVDICDNGSCSNTFYIRIGQSTIIHISYCNKCWSKWVSDMSKNIGDTLWDNDFIKEIKKIVKDRIMKATMVKGLENDGKTNNSLCIK